MGVAGGGEGRARAPGRVTSVCPRQRLPPGFPLSLLLLSLLAPSAPAENFPLTPPLFHGVQTLNPAHLVFQFPRGRCGEGARGGPTPGIAPWGLGAPGREDGGRLPTRQLRPPTAPRGRAPRPRGPCPHRPESLGGVGGGGAGGRGAGARLPTSQIPQTPASAAGCPAFWPPPRRARPPAARSAVLTVGALSRPGLGCCPAPGTPSPSPPRAAPGCAPRRPERQRCL